MYNPFGFVYPEGRKIIGETLFSQVMDFLPWKNFHRIEARYHGSHHVRTLTCAERFCCMTFARPTYRESLRDIEACLSAQAAKLYHMGFRQPVSCSMRVDVNFGSTLEREILCRTRSGGSR